MSGLDQCYKCDVGFANDVFQKQYCTSCAAGSFSSTAGNEMCELCTPGRYSPATTMETASCTKCPKGYSINSTGAVECNPCLSGTYQDIEGMIECKNSSAGYFVFGTGKTMQEPCRPGQFGPGAGAQACINCPPGKFADGYNSTDCQQCSPGMFQELPGQSLCSNCSVGFFTNKTGQTVCSSCQAGTFGPLPGALQCQNCAAGRYQSSPEQIECYRCTKGFSSSNGSVGCKPCADGFISIDDEAAECLACPQNSISNLDHTSCDCSPGFAAKKVSELTHDSIKCLECPTGAKCTQKGTIWCTNENPALDSPPEVCMEVLPGWWAAPGKDTFSRCIKNKFCLGGLRPDICADGRNGTQPLCEVLNTYDAITKQVLYPKLTYNSLSNKVQPCADTQDKRVGVIVLYSVLIIFLIILTFFVVLKMGKPLIEAAKREEDIKAKVGFEEYASISRTRKMRRYEWKYTIFGPPPPKPNSVFKIKILISFVQIIVSMAIGLQICWPQVLLDFIHAFDFFNLDFVQSLQVDCVDEEYFWTKVWATATLPVLLMFGLTILFLLPGYLMAADTKNPKLERKAVRWQWWKLCYYSLFLLYPSVSAVVVRLYNCIDVNNAVYLVQDFTVLCNSKERVNAAYINIIFVLFWPIGVPFFFGMQLFRYRDRLQEVGVRCSLGLLYDAYEHNTWWFELVDMAHKLTMCCLIVFFPKTAQLQVAMFVVVSYTLVILWKAPYIRKGDDKLHLLSQAELFLLILAGETCRIEPAPKALETFIGLLLIFMIVLFFTYFVFGFAMAMWKKIERTAIGKKLSAKTKGVKAAGGTIKNKFAFLEKNQGLEFYSGYEISNQRKRTRVVSMVAEGASEGGRSRAGTHLPEYIDDDVPEGNEDTQDGETETA